jgi:cytochrome c oxidase cbb3-type subunit 4
MKQFLSGITGYENHLIFSMIIFIAFFVGMAFWLITMKRQYIEKVKKLPFEDDEVVNYTRDQKQQS